MREELRSQNLSFTEIAKVVGERWQVIPSEEKEPFEKQASSAKEQYNAELATYKKTGNFKTYTRYLADFKTKNAPPSAGKISASRCRSRDVSSPLIFTSICLSKRVGGKRPKLEAQQSTASSGSTTRSGDSQAPRLPGSGLLPISIQRDESISSVSDHSTSKGPDSPEQSPSYDRAPLATTGGLTIINPTSPTTMAGYREATTQATDSASQMMLIDSTFDGDAGRTSKIIIPGSLETRYRSTSKTTTDLSASRSGSGLGSTARGSGSTSASSAPSFSQAPSPGNPRALPPLSSIAGGVPIAQRFYDAPRPIHPPVNTQSSLKHGYVRSTSPSSTGTRSGRPSSSGQ
jgi:hypothetical protein